MDVNQPAQFGMVDRAQAIVAQEGTRAFMRRVYMWMTLGVGLSGFTAFAIAQSPVWSQRVAQYFILLAVVNLALVLALSFLAKRLSGPVVGLMFLGYAALNGAMLSGIFLVYQLGSLAQVFFVTAGAFAGLSIYATVTKRDLSPMRSFLFMGLIGIVIAAVVNLFLKSSMMSFVMSCAGVLVFGGLTAYDTQRLRTMQMSGGSGSATAMAVNGALLLYLDFLNLFLSLLRLSGSRR